MNHTVADKPAAMSPEMEALKARLKATWMAGDYSHFAQYLEPGALAFLERLAIPRDTRMLDLGCGAGQIAIPAARAGAKVTGIDIATNLIERARERARAEGLDATFEEADAEMLPYPDASFDMVVSLIGAMFAPRPDYVAREMLRVCRPGGRIVMANWTPEGHVGQMFKIIGKHVPPPPLMASPHYPFPPQDVVEFFFTYYGPTVRALAALDPDKQRTLREELVQLWAQNNRATDGTSTHIESEYLEVDGVRA